MAEMTSTTRRDFLRLAAVASGAVLTPSSLQAGMRGGGVASPAVAGASWLLDADGNGSISLDDRRIVEAGLGASRGYDLIPRVGYDYRADLLARGRVSSADLALFDVLAAPGPALPRPLVMCWHYGWYDSRRRVDERPTARFLGGDYNSDDADVEDTFNALKNEFGITADLLSWIDEVSVDGEPLLDNYDRGYFAAPSVTTRRFGWLYETVINLGSNRPMNVGEGTGRRRLLEQHFRRMARQMLDRSIGRLKPNVLLIDGRPVVYMFASHLLGTSNASFSDVAVALDGAREAFTKEAGVPPFLMGDEALFFVDSGLNDGRRFRAPFFDAITRYHHYETSLVGELAATGVDVRLDETYLDRVLANERRTTAAFSGVRNRYTGAPVLVMPSSAAGFAKLGLPTLRATRGEYSEFLRAMLAVTEENLGALAELAGGAVTTRGHDLGATPLPAPPVIVGSWNEEFEGHALFPARSNPAMVRGEFAGFEWLMAIKEVYGWNHNSREGVQDRRKLGPLS